MERVHTRVMPGYVLAIASAPLRAAAICSGLVPSFHLIVTTWITLVGFCAAAWSEAVASTRTATRVSRSFFISVISIASCGWKHWSVGRRDWPTGCKMDWNVKTGIVAFWLIAGMGLAQTKLFVPSLTDP